MLPRRRARQRRRRRILIGCLAAFVLFSLFGFFGLPPLIKAQAEKRLGAALHRPVSIGKVRVNPYLLSLTLEKLSVREPDGKRLFFGWDRLYVRFEILSLIGKEWRFVAFELNNPSAEVVVNRDGSLNFSDLLTSSSTPAAKPAPPEAPGRHLHIKRLLITGARVDFRDQSRTHPFATTLGPVGLSVTDFRTVGGRQAPYSFSAVTESGEKFSWQGWMESSPFRSGGELAVSNLVLKKYAPYYAERLGVDLVDGRLTVRGRYEVDFSEKNRTMKLLDGSVTLRDLKLVERASGETLLELPAADLTGAAADALTFHTSVKQVVLQGGRLKIRREADGTLNLAKFVASAPAANPAATAPAPTPVPVAATPAIPVGFHAGELALRDWSVEVQDLAAPRPVQLGVSGFSASINNFSLAEGAKMPVELDLNWQPQGKLHVAGEVALRPVQADLAIQAEGLALVPLAPYLESVMDARLADGAVSVHGRTTLALADGQPPALTFAGDGWVEKIDLVTGMPGESFAGFSDLVVNGITVATTPKLMIALTEVNLNSPYARVMRARDGTLNLSQAFAKPAGATAGPKATAAAIAPVTVSDPGAAPGGPSIDVGRVVINGGEFTFNDRSISPQVRMAVKQFGGTLTGWSSANPGRGDVDLKATIDEVGPVAVTGKFDPLGANLFVDAKVEVKRVDLLPVSPYVGKYAGYELARGKLFVEVQAKVADRKVEMANVITLDQFTLGRTVASPDATKLPVRLGVALLKDMQGKIVIDVPIQGSLDDPDFKIGKMVWRVIGNLLVKVATSPFALVGSMFGGGGDELAYDEFAPGETVLTPESVAKLTTMVKALGARPGLNLGIEGNFDEAADGYALKRTKLKASLRQAGWEQKMRTEYNAAKSATLAAAKSNASTAQPLPALPPVVRPKTEGVADPARLVAPADFAIAPEDYPAVVRTLFDRKFPPGTQFGTPLPPPPFVQPPPPRPPGNMMQRFVDFVTKRQERENEAFSKLQQKTQAEYMKQVREVAAVGLPLEEMEGRLMEVEEVTNDDLRALAATRAQVVRDYLVDEGKIAPERLFLTQSATPVEAVVGADGEAPAEGAAPTVKASKGPRVFLELQ